MTDRRFVQEKELLEVLRIPSRRLRYFREAGIIPYIKPGHLTVLYDLDKVIAALDRLEHKAAEGVRGKKCKPSSNGIKTEAGE
jgi:hypothetical protein